MVANKKPGLTALSKKGGNSCLLEVGAAMATATKAQIRKGSKGMFTRRTIYFSIAILLASLLLIMAGCAAAPNQDGRIVDMGGPAPVPAYPGKGIAAPEPSPAPMPAMAEAPARALAPPAEMDVVREESLRLPVEPAPGAVGERHIIKNADLHLEVLNIDETVAELQKLIDQAGGYVFSRQIYEIGEERRGGSVSLRVPADRFAPLLSGIKELGKVKNEHVYTDDVTMQFIDLEARITNLAAQEKRLRELLERAETVEDVMLVESELGRIRGELESLEGTFRHLRERINYSAINIHLEERDIRTLVVADDFGGFGERLTSLLVLNANRLLEGLSSSVIVAIGSLPILVPILIGIFLIWKAVAVLWKRAKNKKRGEQQRLSQNQ